MTIRNALDRTLDVQSRALELRSERQRVLASNIANADTPGYRATDFDFAAALRAATQPNAPGSGALIRTHAQHVDIGGGPMGAPLSEDAATQPSADGNTVDMDAERARFADNAMRYEAALAALNHQIKTLLAAAQG